jgi:hypothetical protein
MATKRRLVAVIGDIVGSRGVPDRLALQKKLERTLVQTNRVTAPIQPLQMTVGDQFQGVFHRLSDALDATLWVRLELLEAVEVRFGVGLGKLIVPAKGRSPFGQDGPVWWSARDRLDRLRSLEDRREWPPGWRTAFSSGNSSTDALVNAFLVCRDQILQGFDERDARILLGLLEGKNQGAIGKQVGITQGAVSQRATRKGLYAVLRAREGMREVDEWLL